MTSYIFISYFEKDLISMNPPPTMNQLVVATLGFRVSRVIALSLGFRFVFGFKIRMDNGRVEVS